MIIASNMLKKQLSNYSNKGNKIHRCIKEGKLFKIKNGLYETDANTPGYLLAGSIYGPSYLSFDYALSYYGLIPERAFNYTSATYDKKKNKKYVTQFGTFVYRDVPKNVYPLGINLIEEENYSYQIATKEKALCDKLYTLKPLKNQSELENMLFKDLRIDEDEFKKLDSHSIKILADLYHSKNVSLLSKYIRRWKNE